MSKHIYQLELYKSSKLKEKMNNHFINSLTHIDLLTFFKSKIENIKSFVAMIILLEKLSNGRIKFLLDYSTFSKSKPFIMGCKIKITKNQYLSFLEIYFSENHFRAKAEEKYLIMKKKSSHISYILKKTLFHSVFQYDRDFFLFYDYLISSEYDMVFEFYFREKNLYENELLMSLYGYYHFNEWQENYSFPETITEEDDTDETSI